MTDIFGNTLFITVNSFGTLLSVKLLANKLPEMGELLTRLSNQNEELKIDFDKIEKMSAVMSRNAGLYLLFGWVYIF